MSPVFRAAVALLLIWPLWVAGGDDSPIPDASPAATPTTPLLRAHAHNDYQHERPLLDALSHGFCSVEADVYLVDGKLLVGHDIVDLTPERTLEALYLDPLLRRVRANGGRVFQGGPAFTFLIDFKSEAEMTYFELDRVLARYEEMLTVIKEGHLEERAVTVIISGNRAWETIAADSTRYAGVDGRLEDLSSDRPRHLMPMVSDHWGRNFRWSGKGPMPETERAKLRRIVRKAHEEGRHLRFWATPDRPSPEREVFWTELLVADVDHINTDDLAGLEDFLLAAEGRRAR